MPQRYLYSSIKSYSFRENVLKMSSTCPRMQLTRLCNDTVIIIVSRNSWRAAAVTLYGHGRKERERETILDEDDARKAYYIPTPKRLNRKPISPTFFT